MRNRKILILLAILAAALVVGAVILGDRGDIRHVTEKIGESDLYTAGDIESAMAVVEKEFRKSFHGCSLTKLWYDENVCRLEQKDWTDQYGTDEAIVLLSDFEVGKSGGDGSLDPGRTYKNWEWILVRNTGGEWELKTWGY